MFRVGDSIPKDFPGVAPARKPRWAKADASDLQALAESINGRRIGFKR